MAEAYCVKDKMKVEVQNPQQITMKNGKKALSGTCPKCGTTQDTSSTCVKCFVIFEKVAISSGRQPPARHLPVHQHTRLANRVVKGWWNIARHALKGLILAVIALQPLTACFIVER